uniref:Uncharacterized protein n=1 Tax=Leersia perrieri TaxID=77586 RepID=A0A0D9XJP0_9ORYZ
MTTRLPLIHRYHVACLILLVLQRPQPRAQQAELTPRGTGGDYNMACKECLLLC